MKTIRLLPLAIAATLPLAACGSPDNAAANNASDVVLNEEGVPADDLGANDLDANLAESNTLTPVDDAFANDASLNGSAPANGF